MTDKVLRGKITNIHQIEDVEALYNEAEKIVVEGEKQIAEIEEKLANGEFNGDNGVYVGSGDMPEGCNVQIDPTGESASSFLCNALKGNKSGEAILFDDISPLEHNVKVNAKCKNICNTDALRIKETWIVDGANKMQQSGMYYVRIPVDATKTYVLSVSDYANVLDADYIYRISDVTESEISVANCWSNPKADITASNPSTNPLQFNSGVITLTIRSKSYADVSKLPLTQIEEGTTATGYVPYVEDITECKVLKCGKNLLNIYREVDSFSDWSGQRAFDFLKCYKNMSVSNYSQNMNIDNIVIENETVSFYNGGSGYGIAFPVKAKPNTTYSIDFSVTPTTEISVGWYDKDGVYISSQSTASSSKHMTFTTPANCEIISVVLRGNKDTTTVFSNVVLTMGNSAGEYEPYTEPIAYPINADGTVDGITSKYPSMTLMSDPQGLTLDCEYNKDINKVIAKLEAALK